MTKIILSINAGSSSVKVSVYQATAKGTDPTLLAEAQVEGLTAPPARLKYSRGEERIKGQELSEIKSQEEAFKYILDHLTADPGLPELSHRDDVAFACHRVVHGGDFPRAQLIDENTYHVIEKLSDLAPLHNAGALTIVRAVTKEVPSAKNIAYFDSSFHTTMPEYIRTYPINPQIARHNKLRKYGFHGISYSFITKAVAAHLAKPRESLNLIALHLGSGASGCAIRHGRSLDTSMGLTPLQGLPGATRSGTLDPSLIFHFTHHAGRLSRASTTSLHLTRAEEILNKESGWRALTGTTDFGLITTRAFADPHPDPPSRLAFDLLVDRICDLVAAYHVKLAGSVDALVFAGGIGERGARLRDAVVDGLACLGYGPLDPARNEQPGPGVVTDVGKEGARYRVLVCRTDEQLEMARSVVEEEEFAGPEAGK